MIRMSKKRAIQILSEFVDRVDSLRGSGPREPEFQKWHRDASTAIRHIFGDQSTQLNQFKNVHYRSNVMRGFGEPEDLELKARKFAAGLTSGRAMVESMIDEVRQYWPEDNEASDVGGNAAEPSSAGTPGQPTTKVPVIFIAYSHEDNKGGKDRWLDRLLDHLKALEWDHRLEIWSDQRIGTGSKWRAEIHQALDDADLAILLVSGGFLASAFIKDVEMKKLLERREKEGLPLYPIHIKYCLWKQVMWLEQTQIFPRNGSALAAKTEWNQDKHLVAAITEIVGMLRDRGLIPSKGCQGA